MAFVVKDWKDGSVGGTPLSAAAIEDLEGRLSGYTDSQASNAQSAAQTTAQAYTDTQINSHLHIANPLAAPGIQANAITTAKILDQNVTEAKMATGAAGLGVGVFSAYAGSDQNKTSGQIIVFGSTEANVSAWYNTSTGIYTPQITGWYQLNWNVIIKTSSMIAAQYVVAFLDMANSANRGYWGSIATTNGSTYTSSNGSAIVPLTSGANYSIKLISVGNGSNAVTVAGNIDGTQNGTTRFSGTLLGRS